MIKRFVNECLGNLFAVPGPRVAVVILVLGSVACGLSVNANEPLQVSKVDAPTRPSGKATSREDAGWMLAEQHLPELLPVLRYLREHEPERFETAMRDLNRAVKRLEVQAKRGDAFHDVALRGWQVRGRIDLIRARLKVRPSDSDRRQLASELLKQKEIEWERARLDRAALVEREAAIAQRLAQTRQLADRVRQQREELDRAIERLEAERSSPPVNVTVTSDAVTPSKSQSKSKSNR